VKSEIASATSVRLERDTASAVEDCGTVSRVEVGRLHDRVGLREQVGCDIEAPAVHLRPRRGETMPENEGCVVAHVEPQHVELLQRGGVVVVARERLSVGQPLLDLAAAQDDRERRR